MDDALDLRPERRVEDVARALDVGRHDVGLRVQRQRGRAVHDDLDVPHRAVDRSPIADVADDRLDAVLAVRIVEGQAIQRRDRVPALEEEADEIDAEESGSAGDEITHVLEFGLL